MGKHLTFSPEMFRLRSGTVGAIKWRHMEKKRNIVLFGFMGTGKTSVGKILAARLGMDFVDMDSIIEQRQKKPVSRIFAEDGEPAFRRLERELVVELSAGTGMVIATGGGVVLNRQNIDDFGATGLAVCLKAPPEEIFRRLEGDNTRPLLADGDKKQKAAALLEKRRDCYAAVPMQVDTASLTVEQVSEKIIAVY